MGTPPRQEIEEYQIRIEDGRRKIGGYQPPGYRLYA
jgi:hypothetical protein